MPTEEDQTIVYRLPTVCEITGSSPSSIRRWEKLKLFPQHIQLGPNCIGWLKAEVDAWLADRIRQREVQ